MGDYFISIVGWWVGFAGVSLAESGGPSGGADLRDPLRSLGLPLHVAPQPHRHGPPQQQVDAEPAPESTPIQQTCRSAHPCRRASERASEIGCVVEMERASREIGLPASTIYSLLSAYSFLLSVLLRAGLTKAEGHPSARQSAGHATTGQMKSSEIAVMYSTS